ncbi:MAG: hypothetical protein LBL81_05810 [Tannerella sp.]|jgi:hypothetical protein|nr:hypothetical protein [Tannerella sp.]
MEKADWQYILLFALAIGWSLWNLARRAKHVGESQTAPAEASRPAETEENTSTTPKSKESSKRKVSSYVPLPVEGERAVSGEDFFLGELTSEGGETDEGGGFRLPDDAFSDMEELKKALVYSEILTRKY